MKKTIMVITVIVLLVLGAYVAFRDTAPVVSSAAVPVSNDTQNYIANPASQNCIDVGGTLTIEKRGDGGEYGLCQFEDNRACEEWALMRGDCPVGGRKTTGYDTIDQNYCAWIGGQTLAQEHSMCTIGGDSHCSTLDLYNGSCVPGVN